MIFTILAIIICTGFVYRNQVESWIRRAVGKTWSMLGLDSTIQSMSQKIEDQDGGTVSTSIDAILFNHDRSKVLLIRRGREPFKGCWAFPGGRVESTDKDLLTAVQRELQEETGLTNIPLKLVSIVGNNERDPRGFVVSVGFIGNVPSDSNFKAGDDAVDIGWFSTTDEDILMAFDHREILQHVMRIE